MNRRRKARRRYEFEKQPCLNHYEPDSKGCDQALKKLPIVKSVVRIAPSMNNQAIIRAQNNHFVTAPSVTLPNAFPIEPWCPSYLAGRPQKQMICNYQQLTRLFTQILHKPRQLNDMCIEHIPFPTEPIKYSNIVTFRSIPMSKAAFRCYVEEATPGKTSGSCI